MWSWVLMWMALSWTFHVWCNMTKQPSNSPVFPLCLNPLRFLGLHRTPLPLWWEIISDWSQPLALLQWSVKYCSINHLWLLKEPDSWPPEIVGLRLKSEGLVWIRGGKGSGVLAYLTVKPCFLRQRDSIIPALDFLAPSISCFITKSTNKAARSNVGLKQK